MWEQHWVVTAREADTATEAVQTALDFWAPAEAGPPHRGEVRIWRGPDDLALAETVAEELSQIRQTALQATRQELSRRLHALSHRARNGRDNRVPFRRVMQGSAPPPAFLDSGMGRLV